MDIVQSVNIVKSLSDISRLRILNSLLERPSYVEELSHRINLAPSTVSFHLRKLERAGLVVQKKEQYYIIYRVNNKLFDLNLRNLIQFEDMEKNSEEERIEKYRTKVNRIFFRNGKLIKLPVQHKKRLIILSAYSAKFRPGKKYSEEKVNELIKESYEDYCTIRRLLIEEGFMKRDKNFYWLINK